MDLQPLKFKLTAQSAEAPLAASPCRNLPEFTFSLQRGLQSAGSEVLFPRKQTFCPHNPYPAALEASDMAPLQGSLVLCITG